MKASLFYRIAAVLPLLFAVGHTLGFRQSDPTWGVDALLGSMRSIHFDVQGFSRTYRDLFVAARFSVGVFYLFAGVLPWQRLKRLSGANVFWWGSCCNLCVPGTTRIHPFAVVLGVNAIQAVVMSGDDSPQ